MTEHTGLADFAPFNELEAFKPVVIQRGPSVTLYNGVTYESSREYIDVNGDAWHYYGAMNRSSMWQRTDDSTVIWNITTIVDQFGPLTAAAEVREAGE